MDLVNANLAALNTLAGKISPSGTTGSENPVNAVTKPVGKDLAATPTATVLKETER